MLPQNIVLWLALPVLVTVLVFPALGCSGKDGDPVTITVFAAASLNDAFQDISREFETDNPGTEVKLNFAGSQRLRSQLELGARADVFASANKLQMALARDADLIAESARNFASASMAVIAAEGSGISSLGELANPGAKLVMAHEGVPAGHYSLQLLERLSAPEAGLGDDFDERVLGNVVSEETSVKFVEQKVVLGQADAGILYRPGMLTATADGAARELPLPSDVRGISAQYPIAVLADSSEPELASKFVEFVLSQPARDVLASYGFDPP